MTVKLLSLCLLTLSVLNAAPHPRIFIKSADVPRLRALSGQTQPDAFGNVPATAWKKLRAKADRFVKADPYHYSTMMPGREGTEGQRWSYTLSDERPPPHDEFKHYPPWTAMFQERPDSITTRLKHLLLAYVVTGEDVYFERARKIVLHLCAWEGIWTDLSYSSGRPCLDTGHASFWVGVFYDWTVDRLSDAEAATIRQALAEKGVAPIAKMIETISPYHNFTAVIGAGLGVGAIALLGEDERAEGWLELALRRLRLNMDMQGKDGGLKEGPMYGTYATNQIADVLWALDGSRQGAELLRHPLLQTLPKHGVSMLDPGSRKLPCFGDGGPGSAFTSLMRILALQGDSDAAWFCEQLGALKLDSFRAFLSVDEQRIKPRKPTFNPTACFRDIGYAILRDGYREDGTFLAVKCGPPTDVIGHNHYDQGSYLLRFGKSWIGWDPGYRNYFDPPRRRYTAGTIGHSTAVLDLDEDYLASTSVKTLGKDQVNLNGGQILDLFSSSEMDYLKVNVAPAYNRPERQVLDCFTREFFLLKPAVVLIRDQLATSGEHRYSLLHHSPSGTGIRLEDCQAEAEGAGAVLEYFFFSDKALTLSHGLYPKAESYGPWLAATTEPTKSAQLVTVLAPRLNDKILANPGFERGIQGWRPRNNAGCAPNHVIDDKVFHSGAASARIDNRGYYYSLQLPAVPGTRITARWWAKCNSEKGAGTLLYYWKGGKSFASKKGPASTSNEWRQYEISDVIPEDCEEVCLALQFFGTGSCWYDDVEIELERPQKTVVVPTSITKVCGDRALLVRRAELQCLVLPAAGTYDFDGKRYRTEAPFACVFLDGTGVFSVTEEAVFCDGNALSQLSGIWNRKK